VRNCGRLARTDWEEQALAGVRRHYAAEYRLAGEAGIRRRIREGLEMARRQGMPEGGPSVLMAIGCAIVPDRDPDFHSGLWARTILRKVNAETEAARARAPARSRDNVFSRTLTIRESQMTALRESVVEGFRGRMLAHLNRIFPERTGELGLTAVLATIDAGIAKAAECEVRGERSVAMLIDLVFVYGREFDRDGPLQWTADLLRASSIPSEARLGLIYRVLAAQRERRRPVGRVR
jgi:hypothetical protein